MEAPEKIYLQSLENDEIYNHWYRSKLNNTFIEYTRTDVIVERAEKYLREHLIEYWLQKINDGSKFIDDFIDYMKGEKGMRVIRKSSEKEIVCSECGSILYYETKDIHFIGNMEGEYSYCVKCPECNNHIKVL